MSILGYLVVSGGNDATVRLWDWRSGDCISILEGHEGKVWSVSVDRFRIASGGRYGEARLWNLQDHAKQLVTMKEEVIERTEQPTKISDSRALFYHPRSTSIASIHIDRFNLVTADGLAMVLQWDFWNCQTKTCPCTKYKTAMPDPLLV